MSTTSGATSADGDPGGDPAFHLRVRIRDLETGNAGLGEANQRLLRELEEARRGAEAAVLKVNQLRTKSQQAASVITILAGRAGLANDFATISAYFFQADAFDPDFLRLAPAAPAPAANGEG